MSSKLLWFLIGSAATLIGATVAANFMDDEADRPAQGTPSEPENIEVHDEEKSAEAG